MLAEAQRFTGNRHKHIANTGQLTLTRAEAVLPQTEAALQPHFQAPAAQKESSCRMCSSGRHGEAYRSEETDRHTQQSKQQRRKFVLPQSSLQNSALGSSPPPGALQGLASLQLLPCVSVCLRSGPCGASAPRYLLGPKLQLYFGLKESTEDTSCVLAMYRRLARCSHHSLPAKARSGNHGIELRPPLQAMRTTWYHPTKVSHRPLHAHCCSWPLSALRFSAQAS